MESLADGMQGVDSVVKKDVVLGIDPLQFMQDLLVREPKQLGVWMVSCTEMVCD